METPEKKEELLEEKISPKLDCDKCKGTGEVEKEGKKKTCKCIKEQKKKLKKEKRKKEKNFKMTSMLYSPKKS